MLLPLDCLIAETDELVNGGRSPFILIVDMGGRLCYSMQEKPSHYIRISDHRIQLSYGKIILPKLDRISKSTFRQLVGDMNHPLLTKMNRSG